MFIHAKFMKRQKSAVVGCRVAYQRSISGDVTMRLTLANGTWVDLRMNHDEADKHINKMRLVGLEVELTSTELERLKDAMMADQFFSSRDDSVQVITHKTYTAAAESVWHARGMPQIPRDYRLVTVLTVDQPPVLRCQEFQP